MNAVSWFEGATAPERWRGALLTRGPRIAVWVLAIAIGVQAAIIVTDLAIAKRTFESSPVQAPPVPVNRPARVNVAAIANSHLFGQPAAPKPAAVDATNAPKTTAPLILAGTIASDDPREGLAIIGENSNSAKVYAVGNSLPGGVRLHSVYKDRVLLDRGGQIESLALPRKYSGGSAAPLPPPPPPVAAADGNAVERVRKLISQDPGLLSDIMRPQPVFAQGRQRGYRVYPGRNREAFNRLGLRPGDLVLAVNGTPLDDPARGQEIFRTIGSSSEAHITVIRNGQQQDLTLNMAQVAQEASQLSEAAADGSPPAEQASPAEPAPQTDMVDPAE